MAAKETGARDRLRQAESAYAIPLEKFLRSIENDRGLSRKERLRIVDQALLLLEMNYVHLPLKRAMHAVDPIRQLTLIKFRLEDPKGDGLESGMQFHKRLLAIFASLRDLHTHYQLPAPFRDRMAFLPFLIEQYFERNDKKKLVEKFTVSRISGRFFRRTRNAPPEVVCFEPGVEILAWNGVPIHRAIDNNGETQAGSNLEARFARGLDSLTSRPLDLSLPPDESWVSITYKSKTGKILTLRHQKWMVDAWDVPEKKKRAAVDIKKTKINRLKRKLYKRTQPAVGPRDLRVRKPFEDLFYAQIRKVDGKDVGYIRLFDFNPDDPDLFVEEFKRVVTSRGFPKDGLIIDVRGNPGGQIRAGERLLQLFTPRPVVPELFEFLNTPLNLKICRNAPKDWGLAPWAESIAELVQTGATYSRGFAFTSEKSCNDIGQVYHGPVILITDALSYSTTDMFAAGFQDNQLGEILGTSDNTGAGGANNWYYDDLIRALRNDPESPFKQKRLPKGADIGIAMRRSIRVGRNSGRPLEELGIKPDDRHYMTKRDVLAGNEDLIRKAAHKLREKPVYSLSVKPFETKDGSRGVIVSCSSKLPAPQKHKKKKGAKLEPMTLANISYLHIHVNGRLDRTISAENGAIAPTKVAFEKRKANELLAQAFDGANNLVAAYRYQ